MSKKNSNTVNTLSYVWIDSIRWNEMEMNEIK
jgi:hypothetical protein